GGQRGPRQAGGVGLRAPPGPADSLLQRDRILRDEPQGPGLMAANSFGSRATLGIGGRTFEIFRLDALEHRGLGIARLPYSLKILLENLLRREDGRTVRAVEIEKLARGDPMKAAAGEIALMPSRRLVQAFTGG